MRDVPQDRTGQKSLLMPEKRSTPDDALDLQLQELPRHIAIIMDGNGRWARRRNLPRIEGHAEGGKAVRAVVTECARLGIEVLTLYGFSIENWRRPTGEIEQLMDLYAEYLARERSTVMDNNVRLVQLGRREGLPERVLRELDETIAVSKDNTGMTLCLAINYSGRTEIVDAVRRIVRAAVNGTVRPEEVDEQLVSDSLGTAGLPDPDLLIRTSNEHRLSNFLLWQISYTELYVADVYWPDFRESHLHAAIREFARRERRFGAVGPSRRRAPQTSGA